MAETERVDLSSLDTWIDSGTLRVVAGPGEGMSVRIDRGRVLVGRSDGCDLVLDDARVSATHLECVSTDRGVVLRDLGTTNGTHVGRLAVREVVLADGTEITVGDSLLRFEYDDVPRRVERAARTSFHGLVGGSPCMRALYAEIEALGPTRLNVLIEGETGTGKEEVARALHAVSPRAKQPFVVVDCGGLAPTLVESTLFGYEKGAFTGAVGRREGLVEQAERGTLFLDEVGELPLEAQTRLLRVLEARTVRRVGAGSEIEVDVRVVSATHRDLPKLVSQGAFRADLFFRLATARVQVPPLRARKEDIPALVTALLRRLFRGAAPEITDEALQALGQRDFSGNVRELRGMLEVAAAFAEGGAIRPEHLARTPVIAPGVSATELRPVVASTAAPSQDAAGTEELGFYRDAKELALERFDLEYLSALIRWAEGNVTKAAARAGLERHHLRALLKKRAITY